MKILVIGDAMQDEYLWGSSTRLSPEAPVPVVSIGRTETRPGGAANVAANIEAMGVPVERLFGGGQPIRKVRVLAGNQHVARIDYDYHQTAILPDVAFLQAVSRSDLVVAVDYGKGSLAHIQDLIGAAGKPVLIDPKGHDYSRYRGAALLKPNRDEMRELVGGWSSKDELDAKALELCAKGEIGALLLTQAGDGMTLYTMGLALHQESQNPSPIDVSGAGEAALAAYAVAWANAYEPTACLRFASKAAGIAIGRQGTTVVTGDELWN